MAKRKATKKVLRRTDVKSAADRLRKALGKQKKSVLLDLIVELASKDRTIMRTLEDQFDIDSPTEDLVAAIRDAIADATEFDERDMRNVNLARTGPGLPLASVSLAAVALS